jgi:hypothetical protein
MYKWQNKKALWLSQEGSFFTEKRFKIPNLDSKAKIDRIIDLEEIFSSTLFRFDQVITKPDHKCKMQNYDAPSHIIHQPV